MPIDYKNYPVDWKDIIRPDILKRDNYKCKHCGLSNRTLFVREGGKRIVIDDSFMHNYYLALKYKISKVVLTIAHLDGNRENNEYINLAALCQSCHLYHDRHQHLMSRLITAAKKGETKK
jgi:5-methylcytosine-specific restriction endonuclease McrA